MPVWQQTDQLEGEEVRQDSRDFSLKDSKTQCSIQNLLSHLFGHEQFFRAIVLRRKETRNHKPFPSFSVSISHRRWFKKAVTAGTTLVGFKGLKDEKTQQKYNRSA